jgi:hypothetical protein
MADIVEKVQNLGSPKNLPFRDLSQCRRSMLPQFCYTAHTLLDRKIGKSPRQFSVWASTARQKIRRYKNRLFQ